jgi:4-hydroxybenzoate polyprenyltransferase/geranylgeranylglycerol-phosphate geranylgeranyltransferase
MMRPYTVFYAGMLAIAGAEVASAGHVSGARVALAALSTMCGWEAGLYAGDYYDRKIDAISKPSRPVPSGRVSPREAFTTMVALIAVGYVFSLLLGPANLALAILTTVLGIAYSKTFKGRAFIGNFDRGILGALAVAFGALAAGNPFSLAVLILAGLAFFHDSGTNLVGAMRDLEGDRAAGCRTVPVVYGLHTSLAIASGLAAGAAVLAALLFVGLRANGLAVVLLVVALLIEIYAHARLWLERRDIGRRLALQAHKYLVFGRLVLMAAVIAIAAPRLAIPLVAASAALTIGSQLLLRDRYERERITPGAGADAPARP